MATVKVMISLILYMMKLLKPNLKYYALCKGFASKSNDKLIVKIKPYQQIIEFFMNKLKVPVAVDQNAFVLINTAKMLKLGASNGSYVIGDFSSDKCSMSRWICVYSDDAVPVDHCYVSNVLFSNAGLNSQEMTLEIRENLTNQLYHNGRNLPSPYSLAPDYSQEFIYGFPSPCRAKEFNLSVIDHPDYKTNLNFKDILNDYFSVPRLISEEDILSISLTPELRKICCDTNSVAPNFIYFIVTKVICDINCELNCHIASRSFSKFVFTADKYRTDRMPVDNDFIGVGGDIVIPPHLLRTYNETKELIQIQFNSSISNCGKKKNEADTKSLGHILLQGQCGDLRLFVQCLSNTIGMVVHEEDCWRLKGDTSAATETKLSQLSLKYPRAPSVFLLHNINCLIKGDAANEFDERVCIALSLSLDSLSDENSIVIGTCQSDVNVHNGLWRLFTYQKKLPNSSNLLAADKDEICRYLLTEKYGDYISDYESLLTFLLQKTQGLGYAALNFILTEAQNVCLENMETLPVLSIAHLAAAVETYNKQRRKDVAGRVEVPKVEWGDVGGLKEAKRELVNAIQMPLKYPHLMATGVKCSGILLYGPPGTGKTLLAKAVASECNLSFLSVKGPELLNMYVGQSEQNVRQVFNKARSAAPCVIFFDELDALVPNRGVTGDSGGVMDRMVSSVLSELDECNSASDSLVFVLAATNRPDLVDKALLRPGRLEKCVYLGPCSDKESLLKIISTLTRKLPLSPSISLVSVVSTLPDNLTGADLSSVVSDSFYSALRRTVRDIQAGNIESSSAAVMITEKDLVEAAEQVRPSVSQQQTDLYDSMSAAD